MLKESEPQEELYEMDEEEDEILPEPTLENLSYLAREIRPVFFNLKIGNSPKSSSQNFRPYIVEQRTIY